MDKVYIVFLYLFIYSVLGWIVEMIYCRILQGKWTNRGFLFGPYCPIYGFGSLLIIYTLNNFAKYPIAVFFLGMLFTSILEYITSYLMEKMFNAKWWDYSHMKFNINGRVCLLNSLEFAILGLVLVYNVHPIVSKYVALIPNDTLQVISIALFTFIIIDTCSTVASLLNLKDKLSMLKEFATKIKTQTHIPHITDFYLYKELGDLRKRFLEKGSIQIKRIFDAFPNFEFKGFKTEIDELKLDLHKLRNNLKMQKINAKTEKIKDKN